MDVRIKQFTIETIPSDLYFNPIFCKRYGDYQIWCIELPYGRPCYEPLDVLKVAVNSTKKFLKNYQDNNNELCIFKMIAHIQMEFDEDANRYPFSSLNYEVDQMKLIKLITLKLYLTV